jgi:xanthine dehydrogenase molybdopterin-binding subunit B
MKISMGRHEVKTIYNVDFNDDGKIVGLKANIYQHAGRCTDASFLILHELVESIRQYDYGYMDLESKICKTNTVSRGVMRAPGDVQGHFIAETIAEHVAAYLGMEAWKVKEKNMFSIPRITLFYPGSINDDGSYTLPYLWNRLKTQSQFEKRRLEVKKFNESSKWQKRDIDIVFGIYNTGLMPKQGRVSCFEDGSVVAEVGGIEVGQGLWTKVKQAVSYGLSKLWGPDAHPEETVSSSRVRVVQHDSISLPNQGPTGGSTTSESVCQACLDACEKIVESLKPFLTQLRQGGAKPVAWETVLKTVCLLLP